MTELTTKQKADIQRLSDAMRAGAAIRPQTTGVLFRRRAGSELVCSCALGAAWEGAHPAFDVDRWISLIDHNAHDAIGLEHILHYFNLFAIESLHPVTHTARYLDGIIVDLNDIEEWSREDIADWLLTLV
jgi:hypothetical protein